MNVKKNIAIIISAVIISGFCAASMADDTYTSGDVAFTNSAPLGNHVQASRSFPNIGSAFPLKIGNRELLDENMKNALDPYFQTKGDYPEINIIFNQIQSPPVKSGAVGDYMATEEYSMWSTDISVKDWATSDLIFELSAKCEARGTYKKLIEGPTDSSIVGDVTNVCMNDLSVDIVTKLQSRRSEIDSLSEKYTAWKKKQ